VFLVWQDLLVHALKAEALKAPPGSLVLNGHRGAYGRHLWIVEDPLGQEGADHPGAESDADERGDADQVVDPNLAGESADRLDVIGALRRPRVALDQSDLRVVAVDDVVRRSIRRAGSR
jgi:hypothetical protein